MFYLQIRKCSSFRTWLFHRRVVCGRTVYRFFGWDTY
jgi:hypothetical protein